MKIRLTCIVQYSSRRLQLVCRSKTSNSVSTTPYTTEDYPVSTCCTANSHPSQRWLHIPTPGVWPRCHVSLLRSRLLFRTFATVSYSIGMIWCVADNPPGPHMARIRANPLLLFSPCSPVSFQQRSVATLKNSPNDSFSGSRADSTVQLRLYHQASPTTFRNSSKPIMPIDGNSKQP